MLPGFVDTHRHMWHSPLRSAAVDVDLDAYFRLLGQVGPKFRPQDVYNATLAGALECLDSGITTQLDFAHIAYSSELANAAVDALKAAGLRAVFGYGTPVDVTGGGKLADVRRIRERLADDNALVTMAYAPLASTGPTPCTPRSPRSGRGGRGLGSQQPSCARNYGFHHGESGPRLVRSSDARFPPPAPALLGP